MTCNIEGVKANKLYLQKLCNANEIICLQEHWLWDFEKHWFINEFPEFGSFVRCHDSNDSISNFSLPRGRSGVAILWKKSLMDYTTRLDVGNERVIAIEIDSNIKLCIINVYLPTNKTDSEYSYRECLDVVHDIIQRYESSHSVLLCGDLNGSLLQTRNNKHDNILKDFVKNHQLSHGTFVSTQPTFFHFNGVVTSQIDYILTSNLKLLKSYNIGNREPLNVSTHVPVYVTMHIDLGVVEADTKSKPKIPPKKILCWDRVDQEVYSNELSISLSALTDTSNVEHAVDTVINCLKRTAEKAVPVKTLKLKGPKKRASKKMLECIQTVKETYRKWVSAGKPGSGQLQYENKLAKRVLRSQQRMENAISRKAFYNAVMENPSTDMFYRLIRRSRSSKEAESTCILMNGVKFYDMDNQRKCFAKYYEDLAVPKDNDYDNVFLKLCNARVNQIQSELSDNCSQQLFSETEIAKAIDKLHNGKSQDEYGIAAEHFKAGKQQIIPIVTKIFNQVLESRSIPSAFKTGLITPVLKKGKDPKILENYRGITVTAIFGKLFEYSLLEKLELSQSDLQFGFTEGLSPTMASLLVSEAKAESQDKGTHLFIATLDSQKAFDVVHHAILLDKLYQKNIHDTSWLVIKDLYQELSSRVKWASGLSNSFPINQGVRQGGILSTSLYKVYIDELLQILKSKRLGIRIGSVYIGCPTCADDVALLALTPDELQIMLYEALNYSKRKRYNIHPTKTSVVNISVYKLNEEFKWNLGDNEISLSGQTTHLGTTRAGKKESALNVSERISLARRTSYSLMNTGLHGANGLSPKISYFIYKTYVLPRLLYGLDALSLTKGQIDQLSRYHIQTLRNIQSLPQRTATAAVYMLIGALPLEAELHKRQLSLLHSVLTSTNTSLKELVQRQLAYSFDNQKSFFTRVRSILAQYELPSLCQLACSEFSKIQWKQLCAKHVNSYWSRNLVREIKAKKTLKFLAVNNLRIGTTHLVWRTIDSSVSDVRKGTVKARILTGTYILQKNRQSFSNGSVNAECPHCCLEDEDMLHMLARCPAFYEIRLSTIHTLKDIIVRNTDLDTWKTHFNDWATILQTLICAEMITRTLPVIKPLEEEIERLSRDCFYKIHMHKLWLEKVRE